jgi:hypothetical protein
MDAVQLAKLLEVQDIARLSVAATDCGTDSAWIQLGC